MLVKQLNRVYPRHTGKIHKIGSSHEGVHKWTGWEQEQERGVSLSHLLRQTRSMERHCVNIIDTPDTIPH